MIFMEGGEALGRTSPPVRGNHCLGNDNGQRLCLFAGGRKELEATFLEEAGGFPRCCGPGSPPIAKRPVFLHTTEYYDGMFGI